MKRILVIEDNKANRYLIRYMLEKGKYQVVEVDSGEEALKEINKTKPDLILMDIQLPGIDGLETTKRIRKSKVNGDIPIIAITSFAMVGDKDKALGAGCNGYIEKPINPDTFITQISKYLK
jgi:two-component system cell cycle response regulator DivK